MATYLERAPTSCSSPAGHWTSCANAHANGGGYAYETGNTVGHYKEHWGFDFSALPSDAVIKGFQVLCDFYFSVFVTTATMGVSVSIDNGSNYGTEEQQNISGIETTYIYGGSSNLMGTGNPTVSQVKNSLRIKTRIARARFPTVGNEFRDDYTRVRVYYSRRDSKELKYVVISNQKVEKELAYRIFLGSTKLTKALKYAVKLTTGIERELKYAFKIITTHQKELKYTIQTTETYAITKALAYTILTAVGITKALKYVIKGPVGVEKQLRYRLKVPRVISKALKYSVTTGASITKTLAYRVVPSLSVQLELVYRIVAAATAIQKTLKYAIQIDPYCPADSPYSTKGGIYTKSSPYEPTAKPYEAREGIYASKASLYSRQAPYTAKTTPFSDQSGIYEEQDEKYEEKTKPYTRLPKKC